MALGTFAFFTPFDYVLAIGQQDSVIRVTWIAGAFAGGVLLLYGFVTKRLSSPPRQALWWGLFMLWLALSSAWAIDPVVSLKRLPSIVTLMGLYLVSVSFRLSSRELSRVLMAAVVGGVVASLVSIEQAARLGFQTRAALKFGEWEGNPNEFAFSLLLPFSVAFTGILSRANAVRKTVLLIALGTISLGILLAMSRGALIALLVSTGMLLLTVGARKRAVLLVALVALPLLFLPNLFFERLKEAPSGRGTGRVDIFLVGLEIIKHNPVFGTGLANFPVAYDQYAGAAPVFRGYSWDPHNTYLEAWADAGFGGFLLLLIALRSQMKAARNAIKTHSGEWFGAAVEAACWGALIFGLSTTLEWNKSFWLILMLLTLISRNAHTNSRSQGMFADSLRSHESF